MESMQAVLSVDAVRILHGRVYIQKLVFCKPVFLDNNFSYWSLMYIIERAEKDAGGEVQNLQRSVTSRRDNAKLIKTNTGCLSYLVGHYIEHL